MKISTKGQYALEALVDLARHAPEGQDSLRNVAQRRGISEHYLEQIFNTLRRAGVVESVRGAQGGYRLARACSDITAGQIVRAAEGSLAPVKCVDQSPGEALCPLLDQCVTRTLWARVRKGIDDALDSVTLEDLAVASDQMPQSHSIEYFI